VRDITSLVDRLERLDGASAPSTALPILTFHGLDDRSSVISFPPHVFRRGLARLHERGYRTASLAEVATCLRRGLPLPARTVVITFDDGYRSVYDEAFPVLRQYGMTATVFLTIGDSDASAPAGRLPALGGREMLSWSEIREMHALGMEIGAHTLTHPDLTRLPRARVEVELRDSKDRIEDALSAPVECFAYPYGRFDAPSHELARQYFSCACSDRLGCVRADSDPHALARVETYYLRSDWLFDLVSTPRLERYLRVRNLPRTLRRMAQPAAG
jgi:peptidoglycan/xylan/chitin deacetylase (PgdA/CDA1 family)